MGNKAIDWSDGAVEVAAVLPVHESGLSLIMHQLVRCTSAVLD